ncbi:uncharacterized protein LOC107013296 [Solanum pennellii]|uniref:Uncharacterized protein LOC107013296 n=1 Tax=Solanum pennellii TaxID=28526 RepID=A0ABM1GBL3_SOLPN|nr:uncharacterized protein LOC107013296 [Solanum pennellii]
MDQAITVQAQDMTAQDNRKEVQREKPPALADQFLYFSSRENLKEWRKRERDERERVLKEVSRFLTRISEELEEECRAAMLHDSMDLSRLMVHVQQVEDNRKKRRVREVRRPNPFDQTGSSRGCGRSTFGVRDQPKFKKGHQSLGKSNSKRSATHKGGRPQPKKGNGGDVQRSRKECGNCGHIHSGECKIGTNAYFCCGKSGHMVMDGPQNRGQAGGNAQSSPNPQSATTAEPPKRSIFYAYE